MRYRETMQIAGGIEGEGVIFFAQLLDEMLFDYTMDTYKAAAFSAGLMCREAMDILSRVERNELDRRQMDPILEELLSLLRGDEVVQDLLDFDAEFYIRFSESDSTASLRTRLHLLYNKINPSTYFKECEARLVEVLVDGKQKKRIRALARCWITAKLNAGIHQSFLEQKVQDFFFDKVRVLGNTNEITEFFASTNPDSGEFQVIFCVSDLFSHLRSQCADFKCELLEEWPLDQGLAAKAWPTKPDGHVYLRLSKVQAREVYSARDYAEKRVELLSDLFVLFHHQQKLAWQKTVVVLAGEAAKILRPQRSALKKTLDYRPPKASQRLGEMMENFSLRNSSAWKKFASVVRLHGVAAGADTPEVQLVNLWTALEVVVPTGAHSKLKGVADSLVPFLLCTYLDAIFWDLASDIRRWNGPEFRRILRAIDFPPNYRLCHKLAAILLCNEHSDAANKLYEVISPYSLLKFRCFSVQERFRSPEKISAALKKHRTRISWQISRIYRGRNLVVHDGSAPMALDVLAENAHSYLDGFVNTVIRLAMSDKKARDIDEAIVFMKERLIQWERTLVSTGSIEANNVRTVLSAGL